MQAQALNRYVHSHRPTCTVCRWNLQSFKLTNTDQEQQTTRGCRCHALRDHIRKCWKQSYYRVGTVHLRDQIRKITAYIMLKTALLQGWHSALRNQVRKQTTAYIMLKTILLEGYRKLSDFLHTIADWNNLPKDVAITPTLQSWLSEWLNPPPPPLFLFYCCYVVFCTFPTVTVFKSWCWSLCGRRMGWACSSVGRALQQNVRWKMIRVGLPWGTRLFLSHLSVPPNALTVSVQPRCAMACITSALTLEIANTGSHNTVWTQGNTAHTGRHG